MLSFVKDKLNPFHLAIPVSNLEESVIYYRDILGLEEGRSSNKWADFNFFGHQISAHLIKREDAVISNPVDGKQIPVRHFGIILEPKEWDHLAMRLSYLKADFKVEPFTRFKGEKGEQSTMFVIDPSGNNLEFKSFKIDEMIFAS